MSAPADVGLDAALARLAATPRLLVALDFDGTLAPVVDDPGAARALPAAAAAVERLIAMPATRVALVSGRALAALEAVAPFDERVLLVGSHGIELRLEGGGEVVALDAEERRELGVMREVLGQVADTLDDVWVEPKPAGFAVHTRLASERTSRVADLVARQELRAETPDATVRTGKDVIEFSVRSATKGDAVQHLRRATRATGVLYAGDDVTDEDGFAALGAGDVALKSGPGDTGAPFRVAGPPEVAAVLVRLADLRAGTVHDR